MMYILILLAGIQVLRVLVRIFKERKQRKKDSDSWERFKK